MSEAIRQTLLLSLQPSAKQPRLQRSTDGNAGFQSALDELDRAALEPGGKFEEFPRHTGSLPKEFSGMGTEAHNEPGRSREKNEDGNDLEPDQSFLLSIRVNPEPSKVEGNNLSPAARDPETPDDASDVDAAADVASNEGKPANRHESGHSIFLKTALAASAEEVGQGLPGTLNFGAAQEAGMKTASTGLVADHGLKDILSPNNLEESIEGVDEAKLKDAALRIAEPARLNPVSDRALGGKAQSPMYPEATSGETDGKVKILSIQTVPAPAGGPSSTPSSTGGALVETMTSDPAWRASFTGAMSTTAHMTARAGDPLHSMKIQLHPAELGAVTAKLHMAGDQLTIELQVDSEEARQRLATDSDAMVKAMRGLGYEVDRITIHHSQPSTMTANPNGGSAGRENFLQSGGGQDGSGERSFGARQGRQDGGDGQGGTRQQGQNASGRNGLYI